MISAIAVGLRAGEGSFLSAAERRSHFAVGLVLALNGFDLIFLDL